MKEFFDAWSTALPKPFLNKNNRNVGCAELLARLLPETRFVVVRRNPLLVAQSLVTARRQVQGDKTIGWGLFSRGQSD